MDAAKKMALVPHDMLSSFLTQQASLQPEVSHLTNLDRDMKTILEDPSLPADIKQKKYSQALNRYMNFRQEIMHPKPITVEDPDMPVMPLTDAEIMTGLPKSFRNKGEGLIAHVKRNRNMQWNANKELIYKGNLIQGSNIVDLIQEFVRPKQRSRGLPIGGEEFQEGLLDSNAPREFIRPPDAPMKAKRSDMSFGVGSDDEEGSSFLDDSRASQRKNKKKRSSQKGYGHGSFWDDWW